MGILQKTLKNSVTCTGVGLHTGLPVTVKLHPADENTGITFKRTDIKTGSPYIPADYRLVHGTQLGTTLKNHDGVSVSTVEHLMSALAGCGVDNALIEIDAPEVPIMDGSASPFVFLIECAGLQQQASAVRTIQILKPVKVEDGDKYAELLPSSAFKLGCIIDFPSKAISKQEMQMEFSETFFKTEIARARTFGFAEEVETPQKMGLARGGSLENAIVIQDNKVLNKTGLRYTNEFVRHKLLDAIGDLFLAGGRFKGHYRAYKGGHGLNNALLRALFADLSAWRYIYHMPIQSDIQPLFIRQVQPELALSA